jgi:TOMM system kinase/cyclase fusion protein
LEDPVSFLETVRRARSHLEDHGRVSLRGLKREFDIDDDALEELIEELVDVQQVAAREGKVLSWIGSAPAKAPAAEQETQAAPTARAEMAAAPQAAEGERRQLTVMFCDLVGSTDLSQRLDAEALSNVVRAYQKSASQAIARYGGHIAQYLGDGLLVYFGYPQAHEDDAERAVRAGREILNELGTLNERLESEHGIRLTVRVGVHTGAVVVREMGGRGKSETLALGDTTNIAARLEGLAEPDSLVISDTTLRLVPGMFVTKDLGTPPLKGITEPIRAYGVLQTSGVRSRLDVDPSRLTPLVGRDQEVGLLLERWEHVQEGEGQAVLISGDAGIGKSRLLQTFRERLGDEPHSWLECRCTPYTQGSAFHPLIELVEQGLGFTEGDDSEAKLRRLERGVELAGLSAPDMVPLVASLLSLPLSDRYPPLQLSAEFQRKKTIEALVAWILALGERQPLVMLFEDLHWCDPSTVELLGLLLEQSPTAKVLTLLTFRPDFEPPWPGRSQLTHLAVGRLSRRQARKMIGGMTRGLPLPDEVVDRVVERADGIPIFVEEVTKMVLESGLVEEREGRYELTGDLAELAIPATLQDSLMARLDGLREGKEVAQLGAALGREFFYELLGAVSPLEDPMLREGLTRLVDAELLYQRGAPPEATYTFKHAMIQDTAYRSLLKSVRQEFHMRIAQVLERRFPDRIASEPEMIARHCAEAGFTEQAITHYQRAGEHATERSANQEAISHLRQALKLLRTLPEALERNQQELGLQMAIAAPLAAARGWSDPECERAFERARELASQIGDVPELPRVLTGLATSYYVKGELATSAELAKQALETSERTEGAMHLLTAHYAVGCPLFWKGEFSRALQHLERAISLYEPSEHESLAYTMGSDRGVASQSYAAWCHWGLGHPDQALATSQEAVALAKQVEHPHSLAQALAYLGVVHLLRRERDLVQERAEETIALAERLGFPLYVGVARVLRGWARADSREGDEGIAEMQQGLGELAQIGAGVGAPLLIAMLAEGSWQVGRHDDALGALGLGAMRAQEKGQHFWDAELDRLRAEILLDKDGDAGGEAETLFHRALETARTQEARSFELRAATGLGRLWQRHGKQDKARELLQPVYGWFTEGFDTQDLKDGKALLDELA